jgi:hypothetical protein
VSEFADDKMPLPRTATAFCLAAHALSKELHTSYESFRPYEEEADIPRTNMKMEYGVCFRLCYGDSGTPLTVASISSSSPFSEYAGKQVAVTYDGDLDKAIITPFATRAELLRIMAHDMGEEVPVTKRALISELHSLRQELREMKVKELRQEVKELRAQAEEWRQSFKHLTALVAEIVPTDKAASLRLTARSGRGMDLSEM